jgi:arsenate reductase
MDFVFTVCDAAAGEMCPIWPGHPITAHWGVADPAAVTGSESMRMLAFRDAFRILERRIRLFLALHHRELNRDEAERKVAEIGNMGIDLDKDTNA